MLLMPLSRPMASISRASERNRTTMRATCAEKQRQNAPEDNLARSARTKAKNVSMGMESVIRIESVYLISLPLLPNIENDGLEFGLGFWNAPRSKTSPYALISRSFEMVCVK